MGGSLLGVGEGVREWAVVDILFVYCPSCLQVPIWSRIMELLSFGRILCQQEEVILQNWKRRMEIEIWPCSLLLRNRRA